MLDGLINGTVGIRKKIEMTEEERKKISERMKELNIQRRMQK